jgi:DNA-binding NtrC family response regulator
MGRALVMCDADEVAPAHLPEDIATGWGAPPPASAVPLGDELVAIERARIVAALESCAGNQTRAAEMLKMPRRTLVYKLTHFGIDRTTGRRP